MMKSFPGVGWRIGFSVTLGILWLAFLIIWFFFYAGSYDVYQNIAIFLASLLAVGGILAGVWMSFGWKFSHIGKRFPPNPPWEPPQPPETPHEHLQHTHKKTKRRILKRKK